MRYVFILFVLLLACSKKSAIQNMDSFVKIKDNELLSILKEYIIAANLNNRNHIIDVEIMTIGTREIIYITNQDHLQVVRGMGNPQHISIVDGYFVFFYTKAAEYVEKEYNVDWTIKELESYGVHLDDGPLEFADPVLWKFERCDEDAGLQRSTNRGNVIDYLPCGYVMNASKFEIYGPNGDTTLLKTDEKRSR